MKNSGSAPCTRMSLTQWFTRSTPTVSCRFARKATFSFVPTPSALDDEHRLAVAAGLQLEQPAERSDVGEHARRERGTGEAANPAGQSHCRRRCRRPRPCNPSATSEFELVDEGGDARARRRSFGGAPVGRPRRREELLLGEVLLEAVEAVAQQPIRRLARGSSRSHRATRASDRCAHRRRGKRHGGGVSESPAAEDRARPARDVMADGSGSTAIAPSAAIAARAACELALRIRGDCPPAP